MSAEAKAKRPGDKPKGVLLLEDEVRIFRSVLGAERLAINPVFTEHLDRPGRYIKRALAGNQGFTDQILQYFSAAYILLPDDYNHANGLLNIQETLLARKMNLSLSHFMKLGESYKAAWEKENQQPESPTVQVATVPTGEREWEAKHDKTNPLSVALFHVLKNHNVFESGHGGTSGVRGVDSYGGTQYMASFLRGEFYEPKAGKKNAQFSSETVHEKLTHSMGEMKADLTEVLFIRRALRAGFYRGSDLSEEQIQTESPKIMELATQIHNWAPRGEPPEHMLRMKAANPIKRTMRTHGRNIDASMPALFAERVQKKDDQPNLSPMIQLAFLADCLVALVTNPNESKAPEETVAAIIDQSIWVTLKEKTEKTVKNALQDKIYAALDGLLNTADASSRVWDLFANKAAAKESVRNLVMDLMDAAIKCTNAGQFSAAVKANPASIRR